MTADLHDGSLDGLVLTPEKALEISFTTVPGDKVTLRLNGLVRLKAEDFREGNTVLDVEIKRGESIERSTIAAAIGEKEDHPFVQKLCDQARAEGWATVDVSSSYGCALIGVGKSVDILR